MIEFSRDVCGNLAVAEHREWLVTNGIGGFASGTVAGLLTRRYHGLLIAALQPPIGRFLLVSKLDETAVYVGQEYPLYVNRWAGGMIEPHGYHAIESFHLEGTTPVWTFALADALLEKRVWMQPGANTTYVQYSLRRASAPVGLKIRPMINYRNYHEETHAHNWQMKIEPVAHGLKVTAYEGATPFHLLSDRAEATPRHDWYRRYFLMREANRGLNAIEDHLAAGSFQVALQPGETVTFVASIETTPVLDGTAAFADRQTYEQELLEKSPTLPSPLVLAADQFIVKRPLPNNPDGRSLVAGYQWFNDWGRDTMIALPGLTLATGRPDIAAKILRTYAHFIDQGMLPNRFPDASEKPEYHTVDATLWYFEALRAYYAATKDTHFVRELFPVLQDIIGWHQRGTRYNIHVDPADGLLYAGEAGHALTWMNATHEGGAVTPRIGKAVEVNALWYNALCVMVEFARLWKGNTAVYQKMADQAREGFGRFWNTAQGYCYDVLDGPAGHDASLRPNQLLAVSLPHSPLTAEQQKAVVDVCAHYLLTPYGLRTLPPTAPTYIGSYGGDPRQRAAAYHQGTVWAWLIGPFVQAHLRVYGNSTLAHSFLAPLLRHLMHQGVGTIGDIFDGDPPFTLRGCPAKAWSVAELLRVYVATAR